MSIIPLDNKKYYILSTNNKKKVREFFESHLTHLTEPKRATFWHSYYDFASKRNEFSKSKRTL